MYLLNVVALAGTERFGYSTLVFLALDQSTIDEQKAKA